MGKHLFLAHSAAPSGAELGMLRLTEQLPHAETVVVFAEEGPLIDRYREAGINVVVREALAGNVSRQERSVARKLAAIAEFVRYGWRLGRWATQDGVTLIVANSVKSLIYGSVAALRARVPIVWSVHDRISPDYFRWTDALLIRAAGRFLPAAYIVNSQATLDTIWCGKKPTLISPPGITPASEGSPIQDGIESLNQIVMVGRLSPWKGQLLFIEAFRRVFAHTRVRAVIVGDALFGEHEYAQKVRAAAAQSGCSERIIFTGNIKDVRGILLNSQILVHASIIPEPFGSVVVEGLDAGCAVIATTPGGPSEVISDGHNGLLVPCGDVDGMESALRKLSGDAALRQELAKHGSVRSKDFDVRTLAKSMAAWLNAIESGAPTERNSSSIPAKVH
ncbi:glycosyltransferase family 4 protein [Pseudarthrobacter sp. MDT1-22]